MHFIIMKMCELEILYLHKSYNTPLLPSKFLHSHCLLFLLGHEDVPRESITTMAMQNFLGVKEADYGIVQVENSNFLSLHFLIIFPRPSKTMP